MNDDPLPLTPSAFLEMVAARLDRLHGADAAPVALRHPGEDRRREGLRRVRLRRLAGPRDAGPPRRPHPRADRRRPGLEPGGGVRRPGPLQGEAGTVQAEFRVDHVLAEGERRLETKDDRLRKWAARSLGPSATSGPSCWRRTGPGWCS